MLFKQHARRCVRLCLVLLFFVGDVTAVVVDVAAAELMAKNGMVLQGKIGYIASVAENPLVANVPAGAVDVKQIILLDDGLRRTYLSWLQYRDGTLSEGDATGFERIRIRQNVAKGRRRVGSVTSILGISPFDSYGRRTFSIQTPDGRVNIVQGITEITGLYARVQGLSGGSPSIQWDLRIATSSIPRETLSHLLSTASESGGADARLKIVRLLFSAERYNDARIELEQAMRDYPELVELQELLTELRQYSAQRLIDEILLRKAAGQHQRVQAFLNRFPNEGVSTETLLRVTELLREYQDTDNQIQAIGASWQALTERVDNPRWNAEMRSISDELKQDLNINTMGRLADFQRFSDDQNLPDENKLALLISGWIVGSGSASQNLAEAISLIRSRDLVADYLRSTTDEERASILERLAQEEGGTVTRVAEILKTMKPPVQTEPQDGKPLGHFRLPAGSKDASIEYEIQLPEQYDPYRRYPTIVTLHGSGRTPAQQIDWWSGVYNEKQKIRLGQGTHGYIVIAPKWTRQNQRMYEYSGREHGAVLACLRDACRRFSVDTDRVFLSGHSIGGDAAWDIGLSHPDVWAGVIPIVAVAEYGPNSPKYVSQYWENAKYVPLYFVAGELDGDKMTRNGRDLDRYMTRPHYDVMLTEYIGRGHEHFYDEIHRIFEWIKLHRRDFYRREFECVTMRSFDNFFWCLELQDLPERSMVAPLQWPAPRGTRPAVNSFRLYLNNRVGIKTGAARATIWLAPDWVDLNRRVSVTVNGKTRGQMVTPEVKTILHDARTRADRLHPFWAKLEVETGKRR